MSFSSGSQATHELDSDSTYLPEEFLFIQTP